MADETLTVVGTIGAITEKPTGWVEFQIRIAGREHPVRLETKKAEIIAQGRAVGTGEAVWSYNERDGNPNPNRPGTFYKNRMLLGAELVTAENRAAATQAAATTVVQNYGGGRSGDERRSIERQTIVKAAAHLRPSFAGDTEFFVFLDALHEWVTEGASVASGATESAGEPGGGHDQPPPPDDGDVPY